MAASPPWAVTTAAISGVSVATATRPICAASARRSTWTIIGSPAISSSGLPGRRVAAMRAGISTRVRVSVIGMRSGPGSQRAGNDGDRRIVGAFIRVARARANRYLILARVRCESLIPDAYPRPFLSGLNVDLSGLEPDPKMDSFELNKILGAILGTCLVLLVTSFTANALFAPKMPEKPGFEIAVKEAPEGGAKEAAAPPSEPIEKLF